jgi:hypothetical protein
MDFGPRVLTSSRLISRLLGRFAPHRECRGQYARALAPRKPMSWALSLRDKRQRAGFNGGIMSGGRRAFFFAYVPADGGVPREGVITRIQGRRMVAIAHGETAVEALHDGFVAYGSPDCAEVVVVTDSAGNVVCGKLPS